MGRQVNRLKYKVDLELRSHEEQKNYNVELEFIP
jgi:hypothetical protein